MQQGSRGVLCRCRTLEVQCKQLSWQNKELQSQLEDAQARGARWARRAGAAQVGGAVPASPWSATPRPTLRRMPGSAASASMSPVQPLRITNEHEWGISELKMLR